MQEIYNISKPVNVYFYIFHFLQDRSVFNYVALMHAADNNDQEGMRATPLHELTIHPNNK